MKDDLKHFQDLLPQIKHGYESWGEVTFKTIFFKEENEFKKIASAKPILEWTTSDIKDIDETDNWIKNIKLNRKYKYLIVTHQEFASQVKSEVPPILDDQAQVIGVSVKVVDQENIKKGLSGRNATILNNGDAVILAKNLEEAFITSKILEKCCQCFVRAEKIGGAKSFNRIEAWLMKKVYDYKYSKIKYDSKK